MPVKICGIKTIHDAKLAERYGADAIGLLVGKIHQSTDFVSPKTAESICKAVRPLLTTVLVTHYQDSEKFLRAAKSKQGTW